jgi:YHS domain-containing protein
MRQGGSLKFLGRAFRYILWFVFAAAIAWLLKRIFASAAQRQVRNADARARVNPAPSPKLLHRDPVCGSYIAEEISYPWEQGSETLHFCSRECLEHYRAGDRIAAGA